MNLRAEGRQLLVVAPLTLLALFVLGRALAPDTARRNREFATEMAYSVAGESWMPSDVFADGRVIQPLVPGVVPRGREIFPFGAGEEEAERAGREWTAPPLDDAVADAALGARLYAISCTPCHDARGTGAGKVVERGFPPPPSLHAERARSLPDGHLYHIVTRGQGRMASFAAQLAPDERWSVVRHVRHLQEQGP